MKLSRPAWIIAFCLVFGSGMFVGRVTPNIYFPTPQQDLYETNTSYKFISPLLFCRDENYQNLSIEGANKLEDTVRDYISQEKDNGHLIDAAFYFRDLNGGPWALVNSDFKAIPGSLLKVPLAISVYERGESDPNFLKATTTLPKGVDPNDNEHFKPKEQIQTGITYTIEELVQYMLQNSDNAAVYLLGDFFKHNEFQDTYTRLGIQSPKSGEQNYTISIRTYASFFRVLYNGTYLNRANSEHILSLLSGSSFTQGLVAGLPTGTIIAHKFGEIEAPDGTRQLHDCGIVYKPHLPYLVCVMTKGYDFNILANTISHISKVTYDSLD